MLRVDTRAERKRQRLGQPENYKGSIKERENGKYIWDDKETGRQREKERIWSKAWQPSSQFVSAQFKVPI